MHPSAFYIPALLCAFIFPLMIIAFYLRSKAKGVAVGFIQGLIMPVGQYYGSGNIDSLGVVFFLASIISGYFWGARGEKKKSTMKK